MGGTLGFSDWVAGAGGLVWPQEQQTRKQTEAVRERNRDNTEFYCSGEMKKSKKAWRLKEYDLI